MKGNAMLDRRHLLLGTAAAVGRGRPAVPGGRSRAGAGGRSAEDFRAGGAGRRLGSDRAHDRAGVARDRRREGRADHQCGRRRRHGRAAAVPQPVERAGQRLDGRRHGDGRRDHRQQVAAAARAGDADRAAHRRVPGAGGSGAVAVQERQGFRRRAQGRPDQGPGRRRLGRRLRPHPARDDRQGARRLADQGELRRLRRRRTGDRGAAGQSGGGRHLRLRRVRRADQGRQAAPDRRIRPTSASPGSRPRRSRRRASTSSCSTGAACSRRPASTTPSARR